LADFPFVFLQVAVGVVGKGICASQAGFSIALPEDASTFYVWIGTTYRGPFNVAPGATSLRVKLLDGSV